MLGRVIIFSGVIFACGFGYHRHQRRRQGDRARAEQEARERARALDECLNGIWSEARPLIPDVVQGLAGPGETQAKTANGRSVEVFLTPKTQRDVWSAARFRAVEGLNTDREASARAILGQSVAPSCDWSQGWAPYANDRRFREVYESVLTLFDLADLSHKYGPREPHAGAGALLCPGWFHESPAPTADIRPLDYVRVVVDRYSDDPKDQSASSEWAWVRVDSVPDGTGPITGTITLDAPKGSRTEAVRNGRTHGFHPDKQLTVPRRCIFEVISGK